MQLCRSFLVLLTWISEVICLALLILSSVFFLLPLAIYCWQVWVERKGWFKSMKAIPRSFCRRLLLNLGQSLLRPVGAIHCLVLLCFQEREPWWQQLPAHPAASQAFCNSQLYFLLLCFSWLSCCSFYLKEIGQHMKIGHHMWMQDMKNLVTVSTPICKWIDPERCKRLFQWMDIKILPFKNKSGSGNWPS